MKKEKVLKLLEMDFRRLFLNGKDVRVKATKDNATQKEPVEKALENQWSTLPTTLRVIRHK